MEKGNYHSSVTHDPSSLVELIEQYTELRMQRRQNTGSYWLEELEKNRRLRKRYSSEHIYQEAIKQLRLPFIFNQERSLLQIDPADRITAACYYLLGEGTMHARGKHISRFIGLSDHFEPRHSRAFDTVSTIEDAVVSNYELHQKQVDLNGLRATVDYVSLSFANPQCDYSQIYYQLMQGLSLHVLNQRGVRLGGSNGRK